MTHKTMGDFLEVIQLPPTKMFLESLSFQSPILFFFLYRFKKAITNIEMQSSNLVIF